MKLKMGITSEELSKELLWLIGSEKVVVSQYYSENSEVLYTHIIVVTWNRAIGFSYMGTALYAVEVMGRPTEVHDIIRKQMENLFIEKKEEKPKTEKFDIEKVMSNIRNYSVTSEDIGYDVDAIAEIDGWLWEIEQAYEALEEEVEEYREMYPDAVIGEIDEER